MSTTIQTSFATSHSVARAGDQTDASPADAIRACLSATDQTAGLFVCYDVAARPTGYDAMNTPVTVPSAAGDVTGTIGVGFILRADNRIDAVTLSAGKVFDVLETGRIWVKVEEAVAFGDPVFIRYAAGGNGKGSARKSAGTSEAAQLAGARFISAAGANGLAVVEMV